MIFIVIPFFSLHHQTLKLFLYFLQLLEKQHEKVHSNKTKKTTFLSYYPRQYQQHKIRTIYISHIEQQYPQSPEKFPYLLKKKRKMNKKKKMIMKPNKYKVQQINLNDINLNEIILNYLLIKLSNKIVHSFWRSLILLLESKYCQRNLILFARCWNFQK